MELLACSSTKTGLSLYEAKGKTFLEKMSLYLQENKNHFHIDCFALSLALKQRLGVTLKGPIDDNEQSHDLQSWTKFKIQNSISSLIRGAEGSLFHFTLFKTG